jgi:serine-type D-Ala-D-Ala carboxypeptidase/endopeptidase
MRKILTGYLFVNLLFLVASITNAQKILSSDKIKDLIKQEVEHKRCPGIVVGIIDENGKRVISYGKLNINDSIQADGNSIYEIGSITKVFTSLLLEDMAEHGELNVNDPVSKFLPKSVKTPAKDGKEISLLNLSTQTSGLPRMPGNFTPKNFDNPFADYTPEKLYEYLSNYKLTRGIGEKYEYSNTGVGLLGHILSLRAGTDYETLVRTRICQPLKMTSTFITFTPELKKRLATGYNQNNMPVKNWDFFALAGCGALKSTVNDMLLFAEANLGLVKTNLSPAMEKMQQAQHSTTIPGLFMGMGWHIWKKYDKEIIWHNGGTGGYRTFIGLDKQNKRAVIVFSNSTSGVDDIGLHLLESKFQLKKL